MTKSQPTVIRAVVAVIIVTVLLAAACFGDRQSPATARYNPTIDDEGDLLAISAAGVIGDALGYDATEVLYQARAVGMPPRDIAPTFYLSYLSGKGFSRIVEHRANEKNWGEIAHKLHVKASDLNAMAIPKAVEFTSVKDVPDQILEDMFVCSLLAHAYELDPNQMFPFYKKGWHSLDLLVAAQLAQRSDRPLSDFLSGEPHDVDWYAKVQQSGVQLDRMANRGGRLYDNMTPILSDEPTPADLETMYATEVASENWDVPPRTVREVRYRYLYSPSDLLISLYLSDLGDIDYWRVGATYSWHCHRHWGPTIVRLDIPPRHFRGWTIFDDGIVDFYDVDVIVLHRHLLGHALAYGPHISVSIWDRYSPWFHPRHAIVYSGLHYRHGIPFDPYYRRCRRGRPWRHYSHYRQDYATYRRDTGWIGHRQVGLVTGEKSRLPLRNRNSRPQLHRSARSYGHDRYSPSAGNVGLVVGNKSRLDRHQRSYRGHSRSSSRSNRNGHSGRYEYRGSGGHDGYGLVTGDKSSTHRSRNDSRRRHRGGVDTPQRDPRTIRKMSPSGRIYGLSSDGSSRGHSGNSRSTRKKRSHSIDRRRSSPNKSRRPSGYGLIGGNKSSVSSSSNRSHRSHSRSRSSDRGSSSRRNSKSGTATIGGHKSRSR